MGASEPGTGVEEVPIAAPPFGDGRESRYWHPFAPMGRVRNAKQVIDRGEGVWVFDEQDRRYFDGTSSLWYTNVGHGRMEIADAVHRQMLKLEAYSTFNDFANRPALELAERLADLAPVDDARIFLVSGGGDGIDTAAKLARLSFAERGEPERTHLITRHHSYHGTHGFGTSMGGMQPVRLGYGDLVPETSLVAHDSVEALEAELERLGPRAAAFFVEPVIGAGGVIPPPPGYIEGAWEACRRAGVLFIADAVISGFGRLGNWFGIERWDVRPDMVVFAKAVTSGYVPLGGVVISGEVAAPLWRSGAPPFRHGPTYSGHPVACAAALVNLDILEGEGLLERVQELEQPLFAALSTLTDHPLIDHARGGTGLLGALEFDPERIEAEPDTPWQAFTAIREYGVLIRPMVSALGFSPPLISTQDHIELVVDAVRRGLDDLE